MVFFFKDLDVVLDSFLVDLVLLAVASTGKEEGALGSVPFFLSFLIFFEGRGQSSVNGSQLVEEL